MREILFRGKRTDNGEWVEGYYLNQRESLTDKKACYIAANNGYGFNYISVIPETVGEYIGRTDKNGKKIFEGDIIKGKVHEGNGYRVRIGVIEYHDVGFIMNLDPNSWYDQKNIPFDCEIKGNIYDNPELLKGGIENG